MHTELCDRFGIQYPIFVFTPSEKVAAAVSRAGGMGVLGCVRFNHPDELEATLQWMDDNTDGKPYGVDIVMPANIPTEGTAIDTQSAAAVPSAQSRIWSIADDAAEAADDAPRALMMAAPRCCTTGMNVSAYQAWSTSESAGLPATVAWCRSGY